MHHINTLGDKLQQQVAETDHSVCTGPATSCSNMYVLVTHRSDKSLRVYWRNFVKIFVPAIEFCHRDKSHKFCLIWFFATCCCDKILLQRQRFSQKFSSTHEAICRCNVLSRHVAATCRLVCTDLKNSQAYVFPAQVNPVQLRSIYKGNNRFPYLTIKNTSLIPPQKK